MNAQPSRASMTRRAFLGASAVSAGALGLTGCMKSNAAEIEEEDETTLTYFITNPPCIDPYNDQDVTGSMVAFQLFDTLLEYDFKKNELVPLAAESYTANDAGDVFTFKIKQGNTFHNGETVNAEAFKRGWERLVNPKTGGSPSVVSYYIKMVKGYDDVLNGTTTDLAGVTCPDDYTLQVELSSPFMDFPMIATEICTAPVPQAALDDFDSFYTAPIGNGPFQMNGSWVDGQYINLKRYDDYKNGDLPKIKYLNFDIQKDIETGFREFQAGNIDICDIPTAQVTSVQDQYGISEDGYTITPGHQCLDGAEPSTYMLTLNLKNDVLKDVNLRRAISLAINRESICQTLFSGTVAEAGNLVPPKASGYVENQWAYSHYDKDAAEKLLDQYYPKDSSGSRGISLTLTYNLDGSHQQIMESVISDLQNVGIDVTSNTEEWASVLADYDAGNYQMGRLGWMAEYPSIDDFLYPMCYTGNADNTSGYSNEEVDALILKARATADEDERLALYEEANKTIGEDVPYIPLFYYCLSKVGSSRIQKAYICPIETTQAVNWELTDDAS